MAGNFVNSTYFIFPLRYDDFPGFIDSLEADGRWDSFRIEPDYLLNYTARLARTPALFRCFSFRNPSSLKVALNTDSILRRLRENPGREADLPAMSDFLAGFHFSEVLFSCFATGIGFLEFKVEYGKLSADCIADFSSYFKSMRHRVESENLNFYDLAKSLLPSAPAAELFFHCASELKYECLCYHMVKLPAAENSKEKSDRLLFLFGRGYSTGFTSDSTSTTDKSRYDFQYQPYHHDKWCGSQEAFANLNYESDNPGQDMFLNEYKYTHLTKDYHFLYLMILNQRFAAISYLDEMVSLAYEKKTGSRKIKQLNKRIINLKTVYSMRIISNDMLYQNVYSRLYDIMEIDALLSDLQDDEQQAEIRNSEASSRYERLTQALLLAISVLSVFSALIDAAQYFALFPHFPGVPYLASLITIAIVMIVVILLCIQIEKKK